MITPRTAVYCVIGNPISHSLSPVMHNRAFSYTGYDGVYVAFQVAEIAAAVAGIRALDIKGASVTIPHKMSVIPLLDEIDELAARIGAVNTIVNREGKLWGTNTDCTGAIRALSEKTEIPGKIVGLLGAGGAARAIGFGVLAEGGQVCIANRSVERGESLARELHSQFCPLAEIDSHEFDVLINTTSVGMTPQIDAMPIPQESLKPGMVVMDIVYNPIQTKLLKAAATVGCEIVDGVEMFIHQGAAQFELWTGTPAPITIMAETVRKSMRQIAS